MTTLDEALAQASEESRLLREGTCPVCGGDVKRKRDRRQLGPSKVVGTWWNYKCTRCGYFCDLLHPDNN